MQKIIIGIAIVVVVGGGVFILTRGQEPLDGTPNATPEVTVAVSPDISTSPLISGTPVSNAPKSFTSAEVATHNSRTSCYTSIRGNVYDVTSWIGEHPGGAQAILGLCGKDGTSTFEGKHGGQRRPENELAGFQIGVLVK